MAYIEKNTAIPGRREQTSQGAIFYRYRTVILNNNVKRHHLPAEWADFVGV